jgi:hypothetical protein
MRRGLGVFFAFVASVAIAPAATREIYVWQRQPSAELAAALRSFAPQADGFCVLAAEVSWKDGRPAVVRPALDFRLLASLARPIGLALRIGSFPGPFASDDANARALSALIGDLITAARAEGLAVAELQVDFDCAESKLAGYRIWIETWRKVTGNTPLRFTALPVWLKHPEFRELAHAADGFVLQVHSLEKPTGPDGAFTLCDPVRALAWTRQAAEIGVPFRVALPTYGYAIAFDAGGKFFALAAEATHAPWPAGTQTRIVRSDPVALARLAQTLACEPPANCAGVIWFRLPVASDRLNWDATTLTAVLRGEIPVAKLRVTVTWPEPGLAEIVLANEGDAAAAWPAHVEVHWPKEEKLLAADGLGGFRLEMRAGQVQGIERAADVPADASLAPGRRAKIAWLRFAHEVPLDVSLPTPP